MNEIECMYFSMFFIMLMIISRELSSKIELILISLFSLLALISLAIIGENMLFILVGIIIGVINMQLAIGEKDAYKRF